MSEEDGGSSYPPCGKKDCIDKSIIRQGRQSLCPKHYRFGQMRATARREGKYAPSDEEFCKILERQGMTCSDCCRVINWRSAEGKSAVLSLQHYRDGSLAFACLSCNSRHASMTGDTFRSMPSDSKLCPSCKQIKPALEFSQDNSRTGELRRKSKCRSCSDKSVKQWKESNREQYNAYQREYRAKRKAAGSPVSNRI